MRSQMRHSIPLREPFRTALMSGFSWSSYWAAQSSLLYGDRSGDEIVETKEGLNAKVAGCPVLKFTDDLGPKGTVIGVADNGAFDIAVTGEITLCAWVRISDAAASAPTYILGKLIAANVSGRYGIQYSTTTKFGVNCYHTGSAAIWADNTYSINTWYHIIMTVKDNDKIHFYINNVEQGTGAAVLGFSALANEYEFMIGAGNNSDGSGTNRPFTGGYVYDVRIFNRVITPAERAAILLGTIIGNEIGFYPLHDYFNEMEAGEQRWFDVSGNNRHLSTQGEVMVNQYEFIDNAGFYCLNNGFSIYGSPFNAFDYDDFIYIPYKNNGDPITITAGVDVPADYTKIIDIPGSLAKLNSFPCIIDFDPDDSGAAILDIWDRSNATIHTDVDRAMDDYDAANPYRYDSRNLNINILKTMFEDDYKWMAFPKMNENSIYRDERIYFDQIATFPTQLNNTQKMGILKYTGDHNLFYSLDIIHSDIHIVAQRGNTILYCDDAGELSISLDCGDTILRTLDVSGDFNIANFGHIWLNGNITFCSDDVAYLSTDNLQTYSAITVSDIDGNPYSNAGHQSFLCLSYDYKEYNGTELLMFGTYSIEAGIEHTDINVWFSDDNGVSMRSIYKFADSAPVVQVSHVHGVYQNKDTDEFWIITGDETYLGEDECHWIKATYDGADFIFTVVVSDDGAETGTYVKAVGMLFLDGYCYFGLDKTGGTVGGWKVPYADMGDNTKYIRLHGYSKVIGIEGDDNEIVEGLYADEGTEESYIAVSLDRKHFVKETIEGTPDSLIYSGLPMRMKNNNDYYLFFFSNDATYLFGMGSTMLIKIDKNN